MIANENNGGDSPKKMMPYYGFYDGVQQMKKSKLLFILAGTNVFLVLGGLIVWPSDTLTLTVNSLTALWCGWTGYENKKIGQ